MRTQKKTQTHSKVHKYTHTVTFVHIPILHIDVQED